MDSYASRLALQLVPLLAARYCATLEGHVFLGPLFCDENSEKADELSKVRNRKSAAQVAAHLHPQFVEQHEPATCIVGRIREKPTAVLAAPKELRLISQLVSPRFFCYVVCFSPVLRQF